MHVAGQPSGCGAAGDKKHKGGGGDDTRSTINQLPRLPDQRLEEHRQSMHTLHGTGCCWAWFSAQGYAGILTQGQRLLAWQADQTGCSD